MSQNERVFLPPLIFLRHNKDGGYNSTNIILALFRRPDLEKDKNKEQIWPGAVRLKIIIVRAVIQSWNFADFDLHISAGMGFRQWTIIMPLIPISCSSVSCCRRCLCCAKRCSFCSTVSCWVLLVDVFSFRCSRLIGSRRSRSRGVSVENKNKVATLGTSSFRPPKIRLHYRLHRNWICFPVMGLSSSN